MKHSVLTPTDHLGEWPRVRAALFKYVRRRVESADAAEDIVQDVLERMQRADLTSLANVNGWLYRTAHNAIVDHYRNRRPQTGLDQVERKPDDDASRAHEEPHAALQELAACMLPLIDRLGDQYRDALVAVDLDGLTHKQAAARNGITVSGMKSRVQRGRRQLGTLLGACCTVDLSRDGAVEGYEPRAGTCDCTTS